MAEFVITAPDGKKYKVTGDNKAGAIAALRKKLGQPVDLPKGERFGQGVLDMAQGAMQLGSRIAPNMTPPPPPGMTEWPADINPQIPQGLAKPFDQAVAQQQQGYAQKRTDAGGEGMDWWRLGGNVAALTPMSMAMPAPTTLGGAALAGATGGAAMGAMAPVTDPNAGFWSEKGKQAAVGAGTGAVGGMIANRLSSVVFPKVGQYVTDLMDRGVIPTPGQILGPAAAKMEDRLTSIPILGNAIAGAQKRGLDQFNQAVLDDVVSPLGMAAPKKIGYEGVDAVHDIISKSYDDLLPKLTFQVDDAFMGELDNLASMASEMPEEQAKKFTDILTKKVISRLSQADTMDGQTFKGVEAELSNLARGYMRDASFDNRQLGAAVNELLRSLRGNLERVNPLFQGQLSKVNDAFSRLVRLENATARLGTDDGIFTPSQFMAAVRAADSSIRKSRFARGEAAMQDIARAGKSVLSQKYPDSGTVGRSIPAAVLMGGASAADLGTTAATLGAGSVPYLPYVQQIMAAALARRPAAMQPIAGLIDRAVMPAGIAAAGYGLANQ